MSKLNKKDFKYFCNRCEYWKRKLSQGDWTYNYFLEELDGNKAEYVFDLKHKQASIYLNNKKTSRKDLNLSAYHEVKELSMSEIHFYLDNFYSDELVQKLLHSQIYIEQNLLNIK